MSPLEQTAALIAAIGALVAALTSTVALVMGLKNRTEIHDMRVTVNGQLHKLIEIATRTGHAEGKAEEREEEAARDAAQE